jgi:hypothetical protein
MAKPRQGVNKEGDKSVNGLEEVERLKKIHARWVIGQAVLGAPFIFALINRFQPMLEDGRGGDLLPTLLPEALANHYGLMLASGLAGLVISELSRRRFHARHKEDLAL